MPDYAEGERRTSELPVLRHDEGYSRSVTTVSGGLDHRDVGSGSGETAEQIDGRVGDVEQPTDVLLGAAQRVDGRHPLQ